MADKSNEWKEQRPYRDAALVTPSDGADLPDLSRALFIGGTGNVAITLMDAASSVILKGIPAGTLLPISARRILASGTTATDIIALF